MTEGRKISIGAISAGVSAVRFPVARERSTVGTSTHVSAGLELPSISNPCFASNGGYIRAAECSSAPNTVDETVRGNPLARLPASQSHDHNITVEGSVVQLSP
jgi:hypothetical protein